MSENSKSKKALTSALAIGLAAVMAIGGGTFAYLQGETEEVKNDFKRNKVMVDLVETKGPEFSILPGTSDEKDPKVTVDNTVDAYAYVEITDATEGLVTYELADGWTLLKGTENIYYREVAADADVKEFSVLKNDTVTYDASLTNTDMVDEDGNLKPNVALTFKASATQKAPFNDPVKAYYQVDVVADTPVNLYNSVLQSKDGDTILLNEDVDLAPLVGKRDALNFNSKKTDDPKDVTLDLNGHTVKCPLPWFMYVGENEDSALTIKNGTIIADKDGFYLYGPNLTFENVKLVIPNNYGIYARTGYDSDITLKDCEITGANYGVAVWGKDGLENNVTIENTKIEANYFGVYQNGQWSPTIYTINNATISSSEGPGIYIANSAGKAFQTLNLTDSTVSGPTAVEVKHTNATITGCTLIATAADTTAVVSGSGSCTAGYALAVTSNRADDLATGTVTVTDSRLFTGSADGEPNGRHFVFQPADGASVTINGTLVNDFGVYAPQA